MNSKKKIAIVGASYLQLPLVLKAKEMNLETHCFAWRDGAVCEKNADYFYPISILAKDEILKRCEAVEIDGIVTIASDVGMPTISYVGEKLGLICNSSESALCSTNKAKMRARFEAFKVSSPRYVQINQYDKSLLTALQFPLIVKPVDRSGSRGITKVNNTDELKTAIAGACLESFAKQSIVEEYIEGRELSVESLSWKGNHYIIAITDKITTGSPHFVELAHHQPSDLSFALREKVKSETLKALDALKIEYGASHTELKITEQGEIFLIEVGARMGGDFIGSHLVPLSTGFDYLKAVINVSLNRFESPVLGDINAFSGVYFLCEETAKLKAAFLSKNPFEVEKVIQVETLKPVLSSNDRSGYLIYKSDKREMLI